MSGDRRASAPSARALSGDDRRIVVACGIGFVLGALDGTVVTAAMPAIASDLGGGGFAWLASAYLFSSFVSAAMWGALCDRVGARRVLTIGLWLLLVSTLLCAAAGLISNAAGWRSGVAELIAARLLQGAASGAIFTSSFAISAELFGTKQRIRYAGSFSLVFALASLSGALLGGLLADGSALTVGPVAIAGWRLIFLVQLPVIAAALPLLRHLRRAPVLPLRSFDAAGSAALSAGILLMLVALDPERPADRIWLTALLAGGALLSLRLFFAVEARAASPLLHPKLWAVPGMIAACLGAVGSSAALLCLTVGLPVYAQAGLGRSATFGGICIAALSCGIAAGAIAAAQLVAKRGFRPLGAGAALLAFAAAAGLAFAPRSTQALLALAFVAGLGLGPLQSVFAVAMQAATPTGLEGAGSAVIQLTRRLGMVMGAYCAGIVADVGGVDAGGASPGAAAFLAGWTAAAACLFLGATLLSSLALVGGVEEAGEAGPDAKQQEKART